LSHILYAYQTVSVTLSIAQKIANANQRTKAPAIRIARGSIHFVKRAREYDTSFVY